LFLVAFGVVTWSAVALNLARQDEAKARDVASQWADGTLRTVQALVTKVGTIPKTSAMKALRQDLIRTAYEGLEKLPEVSGKSGVTMAATTLAYHRLMHEMYVENGDTGKAWTHIAKAHDIARERIKVQGSSDASRVNLANVCMEMASMRKQYNRDMQAVLANAKEAVGLYEDVLAHPKSELPDDYKLIVLLSLANAHSVVATTYLHLGQPSQALASYELSRSVRDGVLSDPI